MKKSLIFILFANLLVQISYSQETSTSVDSSEHYRNSVNQLYDLIQTKGYQGIGTFTEESFQAELFIDSLIFIAWDSYLINSKKIRGVKIAHKKANAFGNATLIFYAIGHEKFENNYPYDSIFNSKNLRGPYFKEKQAFIDSLITLAGSKKPTKK